MAGKGSAYEREFCHDLSKWWTKGESDAAFWRTAGSGARATVRHKQGKSTRSQYGDIGPIDPCGQPFCDLITMELKRGYTKDSIAELLDKPNVERQVTYEQWFGKILQTHRRANTFAWMLVTRRDRKVPFVFVPLYLLEGLYDAGSFRRGRRLYGLQLSILSMPKPFILMLVEVGDEPVKVCGMSLQSFFDNVEPDHIRCMARAYQVEEN